MSETTVHPECPECPERVEFYGSLWHCTKHGAWDRISLLWFNEDGEEVDDPSPYARRIS